MATKISIKELKNMPTDDLQREIKEQSAVVAKLRLSVKMNKEKDSAKYKKEKKQMARMKTVLKEKQSESSSSEPKKAKSEKSSTPKS